MKVNIPSNKPYLGSVDYLISHSKIIQNNKPQLPKSLLNFSPNTIECNGIQQNSIYLKQVIQFLGNLSEYFNQSKSNINENDNCVLIKNINNCINQLNKIVNSQNQQKKDQRDIDNMFEQINSYIEQIKGYRYKLQQHEIKSTELISINNNLILKLEQINNQNQVLADYSIMLKDKIKKLEENQSEKQFQDKQHVQISKDQLTLKQQQIIELKQQIDKLRYETCDIISGYKSQIQRIINNECFFKQKNRQSTEYITQLQLKIQELLQNIKQQQSEKMRKQQYWNNYKQQKQVIINNYQNIIISLKEQIIIKQQQRLESQRKENYIADKLKDIEPMIEKLKKSQEDKYSEESFNVTNLNASLQQIINQIQELSYQKQIHNQNKTEKDQLLNTSNKFQEQSTQRTSVISNQTPLITLSNIYNSYDFPNPQIVQEQDDIMTKRQFSPIIDSTTVHKTSQSFK